MSINADRIERVAARDGDLSAWEIDFMESITAIVRDGGSLTWQQADKFEEIESRLTARGLI